MPLPSAMPPPPAKPRLCVPASMQSLPIPAPDPKYFPNPTPLSKARGEALGEAPLTLPRLHQVQLKQKPAASEPPTLLWIVHLNPLLFLKNKKIKKICPVQNQSTRPP